MVWYISCPKFLKFNHALLTFLLGGALVSLDLHTMQCMTLEIFSLQSIQNNSGGVRVPAASSSCLQEH